MENTNNIENTSNIKENINQDQTIYHVDEVKMRKLELKEERNARIRAFIKRHKNKFIFLILGIISIICLFTLGFLKTLVIWLIMLIAYFIGAYLDRDPKLLNFLIRR